MSSDFRLSVLRASKRPPGHMGVMLTALLLLAAPPSEAQLTGSYVGNGTDNRPITGLVFRPDVLIIKGDVNENTALRSSTMAGDITKPLGGGPAPVANNIQSLDAGGFTLGTDTRVNGVGTTYYWAAFKASAGEVAVGSYPGDGADNRSIPGIGFQPDFVIVSSSGPDEAVNRSSAQVGDASLEFSNLAEGPDLIQALEADGFQVGTDARVNAVGTTYHYIAWKAIPGKMSVGSYPGDGFDSRDITGAGFQPEYVIVHATNGARAMQKTAASGPTTDTSLRFTTGTAQLNNIQSLNPGTCTNCFQVGNAADVNAVGSTYLWMAFGSVRANYRSIGTRANYGTVQPEGAGTTVSATNGSWLVTGVGTTWAASNRGIGDRINIAGTDCTTRSVVSDTQLTLTAPFAGTTGAGQTYSISRKFANFANWENCIDGPGGAGCEGVSSNNLVNDNRREVGIAYKDTVFGAVTSTIDGSITDATHTITLTANPANRHHGLPGTGVVIDMLASASVVFQVRDDFVTMEWLEIKGGTGDGVELDIAPPVANKYVLRNLLIHNKTGGEGMRLNDPDLNVDIYNNILYELGTGIRFATNPTLARMFNNTIYKCTGEGFSAGGGSNYLVSNNISHSNGGAEYGLPGVLPGSTRNLSETTAPGTFPINGVALPAMNFVNTTAGFEDLHITSGSAAENVGTDLSAVFTLDIDDGTRTPVWDVGADEQGATTEVVLESFSAAPLDVAVEISWKTASELRNLGFHLHRSNSAAGPWARITSSLIPGLGSSPIGRSYSFRDAGLTNGVRYFYLLEDVDASGVSSLHGPVSATPVAGAAISSGPADPSQPDAGRGARDDATRVFGDPGAVDLRVLRNTRQGILVELRTGGFYATSDAATGLLRVTIPSFEPSSDPQGPALPLRRALLDAVVGRRARIVSVRSLDLVSFPGLVPQAEGFAEMAVSADGTVRARRRAASLRASLRGLLPEEPARLRASVFLEDEKKLVLELSPLRFDPRGRRLVLARRLVVRVSFGAREPGERGAGTRGRKDPGHQDPVSESLLAFIHVSRQGLQALSFEELLPGRQGPIALRSLKLSKKGVAVPFRVEPTDASFGLGSLLVFHADATAASTSFTGEIAYSLSLAPDGVRMAEVKATPSAGAAATSWALGRFETNRYYQPGLLDAPDPWLWEALVAGTSKTIGFSLSGVEASSALAARLSVALQGASDVDGVVDHRLRVSVNGAFVGERRFDGKHPASLDVELAASLLREGPNELTLENTGQSGVASLVFLDRFSLAYPQASIARGGRFEGMWATSGTGEISGFAAPPLGVVEIAGTEVRWLRGVEWTGACVRFAAEAGRRTLAASAEATPHPRVSFPAPLPRDETTQADYILIAPRAFLEPAQRLIERRESQGLSTRAVSLEAIAERFGHGEASAEAIRAFLAHAFHHFPPPSPRYVLLLGGSTYDPRNFSGRSRPSPLPPLVVKTSYLWTVSDPTLAAVNGDDALPDLAIGRLPASSLEEAGLLVDKLLAWEDGAQTLGGRAVLVADNPDAGGDFEANQRDIQASFLAGRGSELLFLRELGSQTRPAILGAFDAGASLMSYVGHGGAAVWASENVLNSWDVASLQPQSRQPVLLTLNCLNGYFLAPTFNSLAEAFLKAEGRGSIAGFSPSGLSLDAPAHLYHRGVVQELVSARHERLGDAILAAQKAYAESGAMPELVSIYHLLGDPATRLRD